MCLSNVMIFKITFKDELYFPLDSAVDMGTEMLEIDLQMTKDKQVVVCHDNHLSRIAGLDCQVSDLNYKVKVSSSSDITVVIYCHLLDNKLGLYSF